MTSEDSTPLKNIVEAALLAANEAITIDRILSLFPDDARPARDEIRAALDALRDDYADRGVELKQIENAFRFQARREYAPWLRKLWEGRPPRYSRALLETLAIIAYRQPVTRGEIEEIRGVSVSSETIKTLLERDWVRQVGQRDVPGKPALYGTTRAFLEHFNLRALSELPPLAEIRDIETIAAELNPTLVPDDSGSETADATPETPAPAADGVSAPSARE